MKIILIPLDDRPCNYEQVAHLGKIAKLEVVLPPIEMVNSHTENFDFNKIQAFLLESLKQKPDAVVLSIDLWCYGGLIRSRKMDISEKEAIHRLQTLRQIIEKNSNVRFYLHNVLLRLSVTVNAAQPEAVWKDIFEYSTLLDPTLENTPHAVEKRRALKAKIPASVLSEYLAARERNHAVNIYALQLLGESKYLLFGQEDCAPQGIHRVEKTKIKDQIAKLDSGDQKKVTLLTGADEMSSLLLARAYIDSKGLTSKSIPLTWEMDDTEGLFRISKYEDISVGENFELHLAPSPFFVDHDGKPGGGKIIGFAMSEKGQPDLCFEKSSDDPLSSETLSVIRSLRAGYGILDLRCGNGADSKVMVEILKSLPWRNWGAFSAWNTTGNRMGTLIAQFTLAFLSKKFGEFSRQAHENYIAHRLLDDWIYPSIVRPKLQVLAKDRGLNSWALSENDWKEFSSICHSEMTLASAIIPEFPTFQASLPWPRLFEVKITL